MNIVVLSPHRGDAAFSLGLTIGAWLAAGHRVTVAGVFTRSVTAPYSDADTVHPNDLLTYVSGMRRREDAEFVKLVPGLRLVEFNLKDALLRLRCTADEVYTLAPSADDTAVAKIQKGLAKLAAERAIDAILLPLALGRHVDHLVARDAALGFAADLTCAFYEDLPDAMRSTGDIEESIQAEVRELGLCFEALAPAVPRSSQDAPQAVEMKRRMVSGYASQIDEETIDAISRFAEKYGGGERIWANASWLASRL